MDKKPRTKVFAFDAVIDGHIVRSEVSFSPAPEPGVMTELARFEAERILAHVVRQDITAGRL